MQHIDDIAATINLKKILGIGIYERNEDARLHSEDLYYSISRSPSPTPSSSSLDSSTHRSSSSELSSRASTSSGSCFSAPPNCFKNIMCGCNKYRSRVGMDSNDVVATIHLKKILGIEVDEQHVGVDSRSMALSGVIVNNFAGHFSHLRYRRTRKPSSSSTSSGASTRTQYMSGLSLLSPSSTESRCSSDEEDSGLQQHQNDFHFRAIQEWYKRLGHYNSPAPCELPKPPAHWLTARAVKNRNSRLQNERNAACSDGDTRPGKKNIIELLKSSSTQANVEGRNSNIEMLAKNNSISSAQARLSDMAYLSDLDMATENLKKLLKVKSTLALERNERVT